MLEVIAGLLAVIAVLLFVLTMKFAKHELQVAGKTIAAVIGIGIGIAAFIWLAIGGFNGIVAVVMHNWPKEVDRDTALGTLVLFGVAGGFLGIVKNLQTLKLR